MPRDHLLRISAKGYWAVVINSRNNFHRQMALLNLLKRNLPLLKAFAFALNMNFPAAT
jgi:hypothetical protein